MMLLKMIELNQDKQIIYFIASGLLILAIIAGINMMSKVEHAKNGNRLGAVSSLLAVVLVMWSYDILSFIDLWIALLIGLVVGMIMAAKVKMIQMPQMVALLNGLGGLASSIAGGLTLYSSYGSGNYFVLITAALAVIIGGVTFFGSMIAAGKLHGLVPSKPVHLKNHNLLNLISLIVLVILMVLLGFDLLPSKILMLVVLLISVVMSYVFGYLFTIRVGGADMPITISLLNAFSGLSGAIAGLAIYDLLLVAVGGIVGASGLILTQIMCASMNRKLSAILFGQSQKKVTKTIETKEPVLTHHKQAEEIKEEVVVKIVTAPEEELIVETSAETIAEKEAESVNDPVVEILNADTTSNIAKWAKAAKSVVIVPGYGMALSQAQSKVKALLDVFEKNGKSVKFAIHPVAGRMPGHMNVLLAEVDIPYDYLYELDDINPSFKDTDLVIVIGANDVVNPAANSAEGTPIYGMPILNIDEAKRIVIFNYDKKPGYAGVDNPLYEDGLENVCLVEGDAKESIEKYLDEIADLGRQPQVSEQEVIADTTRDIAKWAKAAKSVVIVPGYGMALSQAQSKVKALLDVFEKNGKSVKFAIHPVAGRMPGHMNVLLAEVDIPYDYLYELDDINPSFKDTDLVIVIGANDVVNPAANSAEGTPIYGMPILNIDEAKRIVIFNYDKKPGYAGVDNPLYEDGLENVCLIEGDAKESIEKYLDEMRKYLS